MLLILIHTIIHIVNTFTIVAEEKVSSSESSSSSDSYSKHRKKRKAEKSKENENPTKKENIKEREYS